MINMLLYTITKCEVAGKMEALQTFIDMHDEDNDDLKIAKAIMLLVRERESHLVHPTYDSEVLKCLRAHQHHEKAVGDPLEPSEDYEEVTRLIEQMEANL